MVDAINRNFSYFNLNKLTQSQDGQCRLTISRPGSRIHSDKFDNGKYVTLDQPIAVGNDLFLQDYIVLYGASSTSVLVDYPKGLYELQLLAKHDMPAPVVLQIFANDIPVGLLTYQKGDDSWEVKCLGIRPSYWDNAKSRGLKISIRYTNDGGQNGNRDAMISWLSLVPINR